ARGVDDDATFTHSRDPLTRDHAFRRRGKRHMERNDVSAVNHFIERSGPGAIWKFTGARVVDEHLGKAKHGAFAQHGCTSAAIADDTKRAPGDAKDRLGARHVPRTLAYIAIARGDPARNGKEQRQSVVTYFLDTIIGDVGDIDPAFSSRIAVDIVDTDAVANNHAAVR